MNKQKSIILSLVAIAVISAGTFITQNVDTREIYMTGSSLPDFSVEFLAANTPFAIKGTVIELSQVPIDEDALVIDVFTDVVVDVDKDLSGKYTDDTITVRIKGGETEAARYVYESSPDFKIGEKVLLLVADKEPDSIYGDNYYVAGLQHGKFTLDDGQAINKDSNRNISEKSLEDKITKAKTKQTGK